LLEEEEEDRRLKENLDSEENREEVERIEEGFEPAWEGNELEVGEV